MAGTLYLCATPIGNLEDMTMRAIRTLKEVDLIAAEDTRNSIRLLNHFDIHTPMTSYHEFNKIDKAQELTGQLLAGKNIALITDAGMPAISDPGEELVRIASDAGVPVRVVPGATACVSALALSGLPTRRFCFEAFLPKDKKKKAQILDELKRETRTIILYEAPHHLMSTVKELYAALGDRNVTFCRELTKVHEEALRLTLADAEGYFKEHEPRGEFVIVIEGKSLSEVIEEERRSWEEISIPDHVAQYEAQGMDHKAAMKQAAVDRGIPKREVYQALVAAKEQE